MNKNLESFSQLTDEDVRYQTKAAWQACKSARNATGFLQNVDIHNSLCNEYEKRLWMRIHGQLESSPVNENVIDTQLSRSVFAGGNSVAGTSSINTVNTNASSPTPVTTHMPITSPTPIIENTEQYEERPAPPRLNERRFRIWCAIGATVVGVCISGVILYRKIFRGRSKSHSSN